MTFGRCPHCGAVVCAHANTSGERAPATGDIAVCLNCSEASIYDFAIPTLLRPPTVDEHAYIAHCPGVAEVRAEIAEIALLRNNGNMT
jgi:hypothetical protein